MEEFMWNPWHGCHKCSEGCVNCYMYEQDKFYGKDSNKVTISKTQFRLPVRKVKNKKAEKYELQYKIPSGSMIMTCMTSDFFIEEADIWRIEAWEFMHTRKDCFFQIITKRPERIWQCLPDNWLDGWHNVMINVTAENQERAWERIPILLNLPIKHKGIIIAPMLEKMDIRPFLSSGEIERVSVAGESKSDGFGRILDYNWVVDIAEQCKEYDTNFYFHQTGSRLLKDNKIIKIPRRDEKELANFYRIDIIENELNWEQTVKEIELQDLAEDAHRVYKQLTLNDLINKEKKT